MNRFLQNLDKNYRELPWKTVIRQEGKEDLTYGFLNIDSGRVWDYLNMMRVQKGDYVLINLPRSGNIYLAAVGAWKAGAACIFCDEGTSPEIIEHIRTDSGCKCVINRDNWPDIMKMAAIPGRNEVAAGDPACLLYDCSGGFEKKYRYTFKNLDDFIDLNQQDGHMLFNDRDAVDIDCPLDTETALNYFVNIAAAGAKMIIKAVH